MTSDVPPAELTATAIRVLCREIGLANTARFLSQLSGGYGDYTKERDQLLGSVTVDEIIDEIERERDSASRAGGR